MPIVNNADARAIYDPDEIADSLIRQLNRPLLWEDSVNLMLKQEIDTFVEAGPGTVLSGLIKRVSRDVRILNVSDPKSLESTLSSLKEPG